MPVEGKNFLVFNNLTLDPGDPGDQGQKEFRSTARVEALFIKPARSKGFSPTKKIPYQAPPTQLGPQKCTFCKNAFLGPQYQC